MKFLVAILLLIVTTPAYAGDVLEIARSQIGLGEIGGDNRGPIVKKYTKGQEVAWCAGFVSWVRSEAGKTGDYFLAAKSYWNKNPNKRVSEPKSGDIIVFSRGSTGGHVGIVETVQGKTLVVIEGNSGAYPSVVKRKTYEIGKIKNLIGFVRLD